MISVLPPELVEADSNPAGYVYSLDFERRMRTKWAYMEGSTKKENGSLAFLAASCDGGQQPHPVMAGYSNSGKTNCMLRLLPARQIPNPEDGLYNYRCTFSSSHSLATLLPVRQVRYGKEHLILSRSCKGPGFKILVA